MDPERMAVVAGWADTRAAFRRWNRSPRATVGPWVATSLLIGCLLLTTTWALSGLFVPGQGGMLSTLSGPRTLHVAGSIFERNLLVLALHALVCVAGYMAMASVPTAAEKYSGWVRRLHLLAVPASLAFVTCMTLGSLTLQSVALARAASSIAAGMGMGVGELLVLLLPHAVPELLALFLPLGAWIVLVRRNQWTELLAASLLATVLALPLLAMAAVVEVFVTPLLIHAVLGR